jgi:signal transduction histidine kinase
VRADGTHVPVLLSVTARRDDAGEVRGYLFIATDQTQAKEVSRLKDEFVGLISHELRTPLSSVLGYLELIRDDTEHPLSDEQLQYLGVAERNANRLLRLVGDLLFTAQVESGRFPLEMSEVDLALIVRGAVETAQPTASTAGVDIGAATVDAAAPPVLVRGDPLRIGQAIDNLVSNAVKFTPRGGRVSVTLSADAGEATVTVLDTGVGIPADELELLFGRFFRASTATRNAVPGVGLGLAITKAIVTAHGGRVDVESEVGVGTAFRLVLPLVG